LIDGDFGATSGPKWPSIFKTRQAKIVSALDRMRLGSGNYFPSGFHVFAHLRNELVD
jgi:hypothetical protein